MYIWWCAKSHKRKQTSFSGLRKSAEPLYDILSQMNAIKEFIELLLEKTKDFQEGIFIPNEMQIKISEIENFNPLIADELSKIEETILTKQSFVNNEIKRKEEYKVKLLTYSIEEDLIIFHPTALKNYLKKL